MPANECPRAPGSEEQQLKAEELCAEPESPSASATSAAAPTWISTLHYKQARPHGIAERGGSLRRAPSDFREGLREEKNLSCFSTRFLGVGVFWTGTAGPPEI